MMRRIFLAFVVFGFAACQDVGMTPEAGRSEIPQGSVQIVVPSVTPDMSRSVPSSPSLAALSPIIFDYGPDTGTKAPLAGCWVNETGIQNIAEQFSVPQDMLITDIHIFTCIPPETGGIFHIQVLDDVTGSPGARLYEDDTAPLSWVADGTAQWKVTALLPVPFLATAGTTYWIGMSGNDPLFFGVNGVNSPGDGSFAVFDGRDFVFHSRGGTGDMMFQLTGVPAASFDRLSGLVQSSVSNAGVAKSMDAKISAAERADARGQTNARDRALAAFINEVEAQTGLTVDAEEAAVLIAMATALMS